MEKEEKVFRPGKNGGKLKTGGNNGGGRPRKIPELEQVLADVLGEERKLSTGEIITAGEAIIRALMAQAAKGNVHAAKVLLERAYGKPKQEITVTGDLNTGAFSPESITVEVVNVDKKADEGRN